MFSNKRKRINLGAQGSGSFFNFSTKDVFMKDARFGIFRSLHSISFGANKIESQMKYLYNIINCWLVCNKCMQKKKLSHVFNICGSEHHAL